MVRQNALFQQSSMSFWFMLSCLCRHAGGWTEAQAADGEASAARPAVAFALDWAGGPQLTAPLDAFRCATVPISPSARCASICA